MTRKNIGILILLLMLLLSACGGKTKYEPFTPLADETVSPERAAVMQAALNGNAPMPTAVPQTVQIDEPEDLPTFDENSFFAEVNSSSSEQTAADPDPFEPEPTMAPPTAVPAPTATPSLYGTTATGEQTYILQEGEDLVCIGRRFNKAVSDLTAANNLESPEDAKPGDTIILPSGSSWKMTAGHGRRMLIIHPGSYVTESGDTLFSIACKYGDVFPERIASENQLILTEPLSAGMQIRIP